ncbi:MAG: C45 family autoproteolytic acyltransferase/hydrolase, partial [Candidatus Thermoplasmatota archaeon]
MGILRRMSLCYLVILLILSTSILSSRGGIFYEPLNDEIYAGQYGKGYRYNTQGWVYLHIEGNPYERGFQHGYLLSSEIIDLIIRWSRMIHNHPAIKQVTSRLSQQMYDKISEIWWDFCVDQCTRIYYDKYPLEYKEEIRGISDGVKYRGEGVFSRDVTCYDILTLNEMYEFLSRLTISQRGFHPFKTFFNSLKGISELSTLSDTFSLSCFVEDDNMPHHCNGFIATGNATTQGQIVISNSMWSSSTGGGLWWWTYYITARWNIILDITPIHGYRVIMASAPGFIWSNHDFYQNNAGIVLLETTLPQGPWSTTGLPLAVRARTAIQYGDSIDDVVHHLKYRNDGGMNAVWLIGDTKTGEIARFELGLAHSAIYRTFNGFYWSCNNPIDTNVRLENLNIRMILKRMLSYIISKHRGYEYYLPRYHPSDRDILFEELGRRYYGRIDVDTVKRIMSSDNIVKHSPDCKITDSDLVSHNGLWVFMGNPKGNVLDIYDLQHPDVRAEKLPPVGWLKVYGLPEKNNYKLMQRDSNQGQQPLMLWRYNTSYISNDLYADGILHNDTLYYTTSNGEILALNKSDGSLYWSIKIDEYPAYLTKPLYYNNHLYVGYSKGIISVNLTGHIVWIKPLYNISCNPVLSDDVLIIG